MQTDTHGGQAGSQTAAPSLAIRRPATAVPGQSAAVHKRWLNFKELQERLNVSERKARHVIAEPWFPDPIELGPRALRWDALAVDEALEARAPRRADPAPEPAQLLRGKVEKLKRAGVPA